MMIMNQSNIFILLLFLFTGQVFALEVSLRKRVYKEGDFFMITYNEYWQTSETAIIVCDMWDLHHSLNATRRIEKLAPKINAVLEKAREIGVFIIHAPSDCMKYYESYEARNRALKAAKAKNLPKGIRHWCRRLPTEKNKPYPLDESDCTDDDPEEHIAWINELIALGLHPKSPWTRQSDWLRIEAQDAISDSGIEIWNLLELYKIKNVILLGVHVNMCVVGRPFGLRQMTKNKKNVVLMRDMTDSMYNPKKRPNVDHDTGTELFIEYIEKYICPTIDSKDIIASYGLISQRAVQDSVANL